MNRNFVFVIFSSAMTFIGCNNTRLPNETNIKRTDSGADVRSNKKALDTTGKHQNTKQKSSINKADGELSCDSLLTLLIQSSSLDKKEKEGFQVQTDDVVNGIIKIKITNKNEEGIDVPLAWLDFDIQNKELNDVTPDHKEPIKLRYDTSIYDRIIKNCRLVE